MKKALISIFIAPLLSINIAFAEIITVDGVVFLANQSNHSDIKVVFERVAPSAMWDSTYTTASGNYYKELENGIYNLTFSKEGYFNWYLNEQALYFATTLQDVTLSEKTSLINVPSVLPTIQSAINASSDGDTVLVAPGTYYENINFNGKNITVASHFLTTIDTTYISQTIIDGNQESRCVEFSSGEDSTAVLIGLTITNGHAKGEDPNNFGGGIFCLNSSPRLEFLNIKGNRAWEGTNNISGGGGGIYCVSSNSIIKNVTVSGNTSPTGGGIFSGASHLFIEDVTIRGNIGSTWGGGICSVSDDMPTITNVIIIENTSYFGSGILCDINSNPNLNNVIISNNISTNDESNGAIYCNRQSNPIISNSIISNNQNSG
ncbi:MAG TPA: hypothetical protein ENH82_06565, partial [bacterium]|nr:hypothetical protein [bacterium]